MGCDFKVLDGNENGADIRLQAAAWEKVWETPHSAKYHTLSELQSAARTYTTVNYFAAICAVLHIVRRRIERR